jgi:hypothetical protein
MSEMTLEQLIAFQEELSKPSNNYVYFNPETGEIKHISNYLIPGESNYIQVNNAELADIRSNKDSPADYHVVMDFKTNEYIMQNIADGDVRSFNWNDEVYQMPNTGEASVKLVQNTADGTWTLTISEQITSVFSGQSHHVNYNLAFYATKPDDVNVLYGILKFRILDLLTTGTFTIKHESALVPTSVYCRRMFDSYAHIQL